MSVPYNRQYPVPLLPLVQPTDTFVIAIRVEQEVLRYIARKIWCHRLQTMENQSTHFRASAELLKKLNVRLKMLHKKLGIGFARQRKLGKPNVAEEKLQKKLAAGQAILHLIALQCPATVLVVAHAAAPALEAHLALAVQAWVHPAVGKYLLSKRRKKRDDPIERPNQIQCFFQC